MNQPFEINDWVVRKTEYGHILNIHQVTKVQGAFLELDDIPHIVWGTSELRPATQKEVDNYFEKLKQYTH